MNLARLLRRELTGLFDLLLPAACPLCNQLLGPSPHPAVCSTCLANLLAPPTPSCPSCALPYPTDGGTDHHCEPCLRQPPPFVRIHALGPYADSLREAITAFKYRGRIDLDRPFGRLLSQRLRETTNPADFDLILPVPLHPARLRERGYNQSMLLARVLSREFKRPLELRRLRRTRPTPPQQGLNAALRQANLRQAFALSQPLQGQHILLVDDVVTTTATARECSRVLLDGGAGLVSLAVLARAGRHG